MRIVQIFPIILFVVALITSTVAAQTQDLSKIEFVSEMAVSDDGSTWWSVREFDGSRHLYRRDLATGVEKAMDLPSLRAVASLMPHPDGISIVFIHDAVGNELYKLTIHNPETGQTRVLTPDGSVDLPCAFSADGKNVYAARGQHIWGEKQLIRINLESGETRELLRIDGQWLQCQALSEDESKLAFIKFVSNSQQSISVLDLKSGETTVLLDQTDKGLRGDMQFFGDQLVFVSDVLSKSYQLVVADADNTLHPVETGIDGEVSDIKFNSGDGMLLMYRDGLRNRVAYLNHEAGKWADTLLSAKLTEAHSAVMSPGKNVEIVATFEGGPPTRIMSISPEGGVVELLDTNRTGQPSDSFASAVSRYVTSFDGLEVPTHIFKPPSVSAENPTPMVLFVHGGPQDHVDPVFDKNIQALVAANLVVVAPNVRGSSGNGFAYHRMDNGDWGGAHIQDLIAITNAVTREDYIADQPIFIIGGSFGGFSVLSTLIQYPDKFTAGVDIFGPADLASFAGSLEGRAREVFIDEIGFDPTDPGNRDKMQAISPLYHVDKIKTPLMVHQGRHDVRVPKAQSDAMVEKIRAAGGKVEYFVYDEGHGFTDPANFRRFIKRTIDFFHQY